MNIEGGEVLVRHSKEKQPEKREGKKKIGGRLSPSRIGQDSDNIKGPDHLSKLSAMVQWVLSRAGDESRRQEEEGGA